MIKPSGRYARIVASPYDAAFRGRSSPAGAKPKGRALPGHGPGTAVSGTGSVKPAAADANTCRYGRSLCVTEERNDATAPVISPLP